LAGLFEKFRNDFAAKNLVKNSTENIARTIYSNCSIATPKSVKSSGNIICVRAIPDEKTIRPIIKNRNPRAS